MTWDFAATWTMAAFEVVNTFLQLLDGPIRADVIIYVTQAVDSGVGGGEFLTRGLEFLTQERYCGGVFSMGRRVIAPQDQ